MDGRRAVPPRCVDGGREPRRGVTASGGDVAGLANSTGYRWQARGGDEAGRPRAWAALDGNRKSPPDFGTWVRVPPAPRSALGQFQSDGTTPIPVGGTAPSRLVFFKAGVT